MISRTRNWFVCTIVVGFMLLPWILLKSPYHPWSWGNWIGYLWANTRPLLQLWETARAFFLPMTYPLGVSYPPAARDGLYLGVIILLIVSGVLSSINKADSSDSGRRIGPMLWGAVALVPSVVAWTIPQFRPSLYPRYLIPILPAALILVGIDTWRIRSKALRVLIVAALASGQILSLKNQMIAPHAARCAGAVCVPSGLRATG